MNDEAADNKKCIGIFGEIGEGTTATVIPELLETDFNVVKEVHLYICSEGGYLSHCFAVIDFLLQLKKQYGIKIFTYGLGEIASGGFFLFLLGDKRYLFPSCRVFVHEHITIDEEPQTYTNRLKADKTTEKQLYETYLNYTATQLGLTKRKAKQLLAKNKWLSKRDIELYNILGEKNDQDQ